MKPLTETERRAASASGQALRTLARQQPIAATLEVTDATGARTELAVPTDALSVVAQVLQRLSEGEDVTLLPPGGALTTRQAAAVLGVSRPYLVALLDAGEIPSYRVGSHRRVRYADLIAYQESRRAAGFAAMAQLTAQNQALGLYDEA